MVMNSCTAACHHRPLEDVGCCRWAGLFIHKYICDVYYKVRPHKTKTVLSLSFSFLFFLLFCFSSSSPQPRTDAQRDLPPSPEPPTVLRSSHMSPQRCHGNTLQPVMHLCPSMQMRQVSRLDGLQVDRRSDRPHVALGSHG